MNIALDDIRSKAPEGATHYIEKPSRIQYWKETRSSWFVLIGNTWVHADNSIYLDYALTQIKPLN